MRQGGAQPKSSKRKGAHDKAMETSIGVTFAGASGE